jgi:hypothetical protein
VGAGIGFLQVRVGQDVAAINIFCGALTCREVLARTVCWNVGRCQLNMYNCIKRLGSLTSSSEHDCNLGEKAGGRLWMALPRYAAGLVSHAEARRRGGRRGRGGRGGRGEGRRDGTIDG